MTKDVVNDTLNRSSQFQEDLNRELLSKDFFNSSSDFLNFRLLSHIIMTLDLYYTPFSSPCRAVMLTAEAIGISLNLMNVDLLKGENKQPEFEKVRKIPANHYRKFENYHPFTVESAEKYPIAD